MKSRRGMQTMQQTQPCNGPLTIDGYSVVPQAAVEDSYVLHLAASLMMVDPDLDRAILGETILKYAASELSFEEWWALWGEEIAAMYSAAAEIPMLLGQPEKTADEEIPSPATSATVPEETPSETMAELLKAGHGRSLPDRQE